MCWGLAYAYRAAIDATINLVTDPAASPAPAAVPAPAAIPAPAVAPAPAASSAIVSGPAVVPAPVAGPAFIPTPVAGPVAGSEKQTLAVQVAPVTKVKRWYRDSDHLHRRETPVKTKYGKDETGPSEEQEDEDVKKSSVTARDLYQRELRDV